jgi:hypothetical protein
METIPENISESVDIPNISRMTVTKKTETNRTK